LIFGRGLSGRAVGQSGPVWRMDGQGRCNLRESTHIHMESGAVATPCGHRDVATEGWVPNAAVIRTKHGAHPDQIPGGPLIWDTILLKGDCGSRSEMHIFDNIMKFKPVFIWVSPRLAQDTLTGPSRFRFDHSVSTREARVSRRMSIQIQSNLQKIILGSNA
jgi:hypothetical protein